jgi:hypothetical protein
LVQSSNALINACSICFAPMILALMAGMIKDQDKGGEWSYQE